MQPLVAWAIGLFVVGAVLALVGFTLSFGGSHRDPQWLLAGLVFAMLVGVAMVCASLILFAVAGFRALGP